VSDEKMPPVSFRAAKPVDPKTRHPFSGEVLGDHDVMRPEDGPYPYVVPNQELAAPATPPESFRTVIADLKLRRAELDRAIDLLERLMP
jgi:hypothetical protein